MNGKVQKSITVERELLWTLRQLKKITAIDMRTRKIAAIKIVNSWPSERRCLLNPSFMEARRLAGQMSLDSLISTELATRCCLCPKHTQPKKINRRPKTNRVYAMLEEDWSDHL